MYFATFFAQKRSMANLIAILKFFAPATLSRELTLVLRYRTICTNRRVVVGCANVRLWKSWALRYIISYPDLSRFGDVDGRSGYEIKRYTHESSNLYSQDINRVWIELEVLRDIYTRKRSASKMVCITLPGASVKSMTLPLWAKVSYKWPGDAKGILKRLNGRPPILPV